MALGPGHRHHLLSQHDWEEVDEGDDVRSLDDGDLDSDASLKHAKRRRAPRISSLKAPFTSGDREDGPLSYSASEQSKSLSPLPRRRVRFALTKKQEFSSHEQRVIVRKLDRRIVLFLALLYMLSFLDRSNIGNAKIIGLSARLHLSSAQFEWLLTAFYIPYIAFEWLALLYRVFPPHIYISCCVFLWGIVASAQSIATSFGQLLALRSLLGIAEAAFGPGVPFYLSFFYKPEELAFRVGLFISSAPLAISFASSLAWGIAALGNFLPIASWRLLFLIEGFPSVLVAVWAWLLVPDSPETAAFLTPRERKVAKLRLQLDAPGKPSTAAKPSMKFSLLLKAIVDPRTILTSLMFFSCNVAFSSLPVFLPTLLNHMGFSTLQSQALCAPPYLVAFGSVLLTAHLSDRYRARSAVVFFHAGLAALGYSLMAVAAQQHWSHWFRYLGSFGAAIGFFSAITIIITWTINNQETDEGKGMGITVMNIIGQCGPLLGTRLYPENEAPGYVRGSTICAMFMLLVIVLAMILRLVLMWQNRRRDRREGIGRRIDAGEEQVEMNSRSQQKKEELQKSFRFIV